MARHRWESDLGDGSVDAAAELPPQSNLQRFIADGADLVAFSGGKALGGPQGSGILCGRRDLIMAAALQSLDMDVFDALWSPPPTLIDRGMMDFLLAARPPLIDMEQGRLCLCSSGGTWEPDQFSRQLAWVESFLSRWPTHLVTRLSEVA